MAYTAQFLKFTFIFGIDGQDEIADTSISYSAGTGWLSAATSLGELAATDLEDMAAALLTLYGTSGGRWADYSALIAVKAAAVGTDGKYLAEPLLWEDATPTGGTTIGNPAQVTTVLSLGSGATLGGGNRGRMYLPHFYMSQLTNSPFTDGGQAQTLVTNAATMMAAWTTIVDGAVTSSVHPVIMSQASGGNAKRVTTLRVGNVSDTQRRRRNALVETYFSAVVP